MTMFYTFKVLTPVEVTGQEVFDKVRKLGDGFCGHKLRGEYFERTKLPDRYFDTHPLFDQSLSIKLMSYNILILVA